MQKVNIEKVKKGYKVIIDNNEFLLDKGTRSITRLGLYMDIRKENSFSRIFSDIEKLYKDLGAIYVDDTKKLSEKLSNYYDSE